MNRIFQGTEGGKRISGRKMQHVKVHKTHGAHGKLGVAEAQADVGDEVEEPGSGQTRESFVYGAVTFGPFLFLKPNLLLTWQALCQANLSTVYKNE